MWSAGNKKRRVDQSLFDLDNFYALILVDNIVIDLSLINIYGILMKYIAVTT